MYSLLAFTVMFDSPSHPRLLIELRIAPALEPWQVQAEVTAW